MNKKKRGEKKPNLGPVRTIQDAENLLASIKLTRSLIVAKISEFFDPCGFFEPIKLQMKLLTGTLKGKGWEEVLSEEDQTVWRKILKGYVDLPNIVIPRFCLPSNEVSSSKIRLICLADAAYVLLRPFMYSVYYVLLLGHLVINCTLYFLYY